MNDKNVEGFFLVYAVDGLIGRKDNVDSKTLILWLIDMKDKIPLHVNTKNGTSLEAFTKKNYMIYTRLA